MANLYAQLDDLKSLLRIPASDTVDDAQLARSIEAASRRIDGVCDRIFYQEPTTSARVYDATNLASVSIDDVSTLSGFIVRVDDGFSYGTTLVLDVDFRVEPLNNLSKGLPFYRLVSLSGIFPRSTVRPGVQVTAQWGWPSVPSAITEATLLMAGRLFKRGDSLLGVAGFTDMGVITVRGVDPDVDHLIQPFRRMAVG
jgi:hypothetical protein